MIQVLEGIKILDLSRVYAAPAGSMILGDLGAEVIRIEALKGSDSMREWPPYYNEESTYYLSANRNKRSITLNLKKKKGKDIFLSLVKNADVVLENFKTGTLERLGLDYEQLKLINEKIILCSVTGYGQTGPLDKEPGFDPVIQAISGLMDVTGELDGEPTKIGIPIADILTSNYVAISILAALRLRDKAQVGQHIDLSLLDVQLASLANVSSSYLNGGHRTKRLGNSHNNVVPYQVFPCKDRPIMLCVGNNTMFERLCNILERPEWIHHPKFITNEQRLKNREEIVKEIKCILMERNADEWLQLFMKSQIPASKINTIVEAFEHEQVKYRDLIETLYHPRIGAIKLTKSPLRFSGLNVKSKYAPPLLGEHTDEVLCEELGLGESELEFLREQKII